MIINFTLIKKKWLQFWKAQIKTRNESAINSGLRKTENIRNRDWTFKNTIQHPTTKQPKTMYEYKIKTKQQKRKITT